MSFPLVNFFKMVILAIIILGVILAALDDFHRFYIAYYPKLSLLDFVVYFFKVKWIKLSFLMGFYWISCIYYDVKKMAKFSDMTLTGVVATMNYLEIGVRTRDMQQIQEGRSMRDMMKEKITLFLMGVPNKDDALTAKAIRKNKIVSLREDMRSREG